MLVLPTRHLPPYIDFRNAFGYVRPCKSINYSNLEDLGYPHDTIELIGNIYTNSTTSFHGSHLS